MKNFIPKGYFAGQKPHLAEVAALHCIQVIPGSWYIVSKSFLDPGTHRAAASQGMMWSL